MILSKNGREKPPRDKVKDKKTRGLSFRDNPFRVKQAALRKPLPKPLRKR